MFDTETGISNEHVHRPIQVTAIRSRDRSMLARVARKDESATVCMHNANEVAQFDSRKSPESTVAEFDCWLAEPMERVIVRRCYDSRGAFATACSRPGDAGMPAIPLVPLSAGRRAAQNRAN